MAITRKTTHKSEALSRLVQQFKGKTNIENLLTPQVSQVSLLEDVFADLLTHRADSADLATGTSTSVGQGFLQSTSSSFTPGAFANAFLEDSNGRLYRIVSNTATKITIFEQVTPASGAFVVGTTVGTNLDNLGRLVGELRQGKKDGDYRAAIRNRIVSNTSLATLEALLTIIKDSFDYTGVSPITVVENYPGSITFSGTGMRWATADSALKAFNLLTRAKPAGVRLEFIYEVGTAPFFVFDTGTGGGFDNDTGTEPTAGKFVGILIG